MCVTPEDLISRQQVEDTVVRMFVATDERDWQTLERCFTELFVLDMTSMVGGSPATMTPRQVAESWAEGFRMLDHVHHQIGNFRTDVDGPHARVQCYGIALHYRVGIAAAVKSRRFIGTYDLDLTAASGRWQISKLKFNLKFVDGNLELEKTA